MGRHCKCSGIFHQCHFMNKVFWNCLLRVKIVNESLLCKIQLCIYNKCSFLAVHKKQRKSSDNWWTPSIVAWLQQKIKVSFCVFAEAENKENVTQMWKVIYFSLWKWKHSAAAKDGCGFTEVILSQFCWTGELYCIVFCILHITF